VDVNESRSKVFEISKVLLGSELYTAVTVLKQESLREGII
jgi:hypothetical protein